MTQPQTSKDLIKIENLVNKENYDLSPSRKSVDRKFFNVSNETRFLLYFYNQVTQFPTLQQCSQLAITLNVDLETIRRWFENHRRLRSQKLETIASVASSLYGK